MDPRILHHEWAILETVSPPTGSPGPAVEIAGAGPAADYARRLLGDLGLAVAFAPGPPDPHPALAWARSGAMALTGHADGLPRVPDGPLASCAAGAGRALRALGAAAPADAAALLGARAAAAGLGRRGRTSPGGSCRLLRAADGWGALNLARPEDAAALPAWLETAAPPDADPWDFAARALPARRLDAWVQRAAWLGLPFAACERPAPGPWLRLFTRGRDAPPPARPPRVLDLSSLWAGPLCGALLAASGAEVWKVESAARPDGARSGPPAFFEALNAGKRSVQLDFARDADRARLAALVDGADVVIEASRPRALAQLGIDAQRFVEARPGRIWLCLTGYGRDDAPPGRIAFGDDAAVAAGCALAVADAVGPLFCGDALADPLAGLHAAVAVQAAWRCGQGIGLDLSLRDVCAFALGFATVDDFEVEGTAAAAQVCAEGPGGGAAAVEAPRLEPVAARVRAGKAMDEPGAAEAAPC